jgi:hypothetical protein
MLGSARAALRLGAVATVVALASLPGASAAEAVTTLRVSDPRGDMVRVEEGGTNPRPAPGATLADVVRTTFRHTDHRIIVRVKFADLTRTGKRLNLWVDVRDETGRTVVLGVEATRRDRTGHPILMTNRGRDIPCEVHHRIRYGRDVIRASVPRRCLGAPESVQFRVLTEHVRRSWAYAYLDNGLSASLDDRRWTRPLRRG